MCRFQMKKPVVQQKDIANSPGELHNSFYSYKIVSNQVSSVNDLCDEHPVNCIGFWR